MQTFLITGGSRGLGRSIAEQAVRQGFSVALVARGRTALEETKKHLEAMADANQVISIHPCDLRVQDEVRLSFQQIDTAHGQIRCLVNNAGTWMGRVSATNLTPNDFHSALNANFFSAVHCVTEVLRLFRFDSGHELSIVNVGATASKRGGSQLAPFAVSKASLKIYSESLARELGPRGIHVAHLIIDGIINNDRTRQLNTDTAPEKYLQPEAIADEIIRVALQPKSSWTFEWDLRPYNEIW